MKISHFIPIIIISLLLAIMATLLYKRQHQSTKQDSFLIGQTIPKSVLPLLFKENELFKTTALNQSAYLLNIFGSWCISCISEYPFLMQLKEENVIPVYAINWKDTKDKAKIFLNNLGNPYQAIGFDPRGSAVVALGVKTAPETLLISNKGTILHRHRGVLTQQVFVQSFLPKLKGYE